jgi:hypothetical protein
MLKENLFIILHKLATAETHDREVMQECISKKLDRSLDNYESHLEDTCRYVLNRNPISMLKALVKPTNNRTKSEEEY